MPGMSLRTRIISGMIAVMLLVSCGTPDDPADLPVDDPTNTTDQGTPTTDQGTPTTDDGY